MTLARDYVAILDSADKGIAPILNPLDRLQLTQE